MRIPWFRVHGVVLNDPGRLISVHCIHTGLVAGWAGLNLLFESIVFDNSDLIFHPIWKQGMYVLPFCSRLGLVFSSINNSTILIFGIFSHLLLAGLIVLAGSWHWAFWDLDVFLFYKRLALDLLRIFGIHLVLASILCFFFGYGHLTGSAGPGFWTTDSFGLIGEIRGIKPSFLLKALSISSFGGLAAHHISSGLLGSIAGFWHISARPGITLSSLLNTLNIESALSSSLPPVFLGSAIVSATSWYGSSSCTNELFGPVRFAWDSSLFFQELQSRFLNTSNWNASPEQLLLYDSIGSNPAKGGLFRSGPMFKTNGIIENWVGHVDFYDQNGNLLLVRRMPAFFETFPVILLNQAGEVRADIAFRRSDARFSIDLGGIYVSLEGGILGKQSFQTSSICKSLARKAQLGQVFTYVQILNSISDGVFRTSIRGWFTLAHSLFTFIFLLGHIWHGGRTFFRDIWLGIV